MLAVRAFADQAGEAISGHSAAAYAALFDTPCLFHTDDGVEIVATPDAAAARHQILRRANDTFGVKAMDVKVLVERPLGNALTLARVEVSLRLKGGARTDPSAECWLLREVDGRLRFCLIANPTSAVVLDLPPRDSEPRAAHPGPGVPLGPAATATEADIDRLIDAMTRSFNARDVAVQVAMMDLPNAKIADGETRLMTDEAALRARVAAFFAAILDFGDVTLTQTRRFVRLYGACQYAVRVEVVAALPDGTTFDPYQEVWFLRVADGALRISAFVNPFSPRVMPEPEPIGDAP